jgi:hypothetical protein
MRLARLMRMMNSTVLEVTGRVGGMVSLQGPVKSVGPAGDTTGGNEFLARMLFVVISTEPVRERS